MTSTEYSLANWAKKHQGFLNVYPSRGNAKVSARVWQSLKPRSVTRLDQIMKAAKLYNDLCKAKGTQAQFIKRCENWLTEECWTEAEQYKSMMPMNSANTGNHKPASERKDDDTL